jgi:hypothetical protein
MSHHLLEQVLRCCTRLHCRRPHQTTRTSLLCRGTWRHTARAHAIRTWWKRRRSCARGTNRANPEDVHGDDDGAGLRVGDGMMDGV